MALAKGDQPAVVPEVASDAAPVTVAVEPEAVPAVVPEVPVSPDGTYVVLVFIGGTRDGEPWPAIGESISLPDDEARSYIRAGYVRAPESD